MKNIFALILVLLLTLTLCAAVLADAPAEDAAAAESADVVVADAEAEAEAEEAAGGIDFTLDRLPANLGRMGVGMLCIIIVMGVLIAVTTVLNKVTAQKK